MHREGRVVDSHSRVPWSGHRRFLRDLLIVLEPQRVLDLTAGSAADVVRQVGNDISIVSEPPAQLILADGNLPEELSVLDDTVALVNHWDGRDGGILLPNGLVAITGEQGRWLTEPGLRRWLSGYCGPASDEEELVVWHINELESELKVHEQRIEVLQRELLAARDEVQQLLPLQVSPKAQLSALRRSIPVSIGKRLAGRQASRRTKRKVSDVALARLKGQSLTDLLTAHFDPDWCGQPLEEFSASRLWTGAPVSAEHQAALTHPADALTALEWGPSQLVTPDGTHQGVVADLVTQAAPRLVTVDIWDTLIMRDRPADAAKLATARRMVLRPEAARAIPELDVFEVMATRVRVEAELAAKDPVQEYLLEDVIAGTLQTLGLDAGPELVALLTEAEVADEGRWSRVRPDISDLVDGTDVALVSDFYMTSAALRQVVAGADPRWREVPIYVSVERGCSKRLGGGLLELVRQEAGVAAAQHLHIGDNVHADVSMQTRSGGLALQVQPLRHFPAPGQFGPDDVLVCAEELQRRLAQFDQAHPTDDIHRAAGRKSAALAVALVARALEEAYRCDVDRVHYVSREGLFLARVHDLIEPILRPAGVPGVASVHLALSRRATFAASLQAPYRLSLQRMWSMYARQTPRAMLVSIGVEPQDFVESLQSAGLDLDVAFADARRDPRVATFLADPAVEARLTEHVKRSRDLLRQYVTARSRITDPFMVVDIGWRGTIQDNLVRALNIKSSVGVYFGLFPFLNSQPPGSHKIAVAFDGNLGEEFSFADPPAVLERPWTPDVPSTIGFEEQAANVVPVHAKEPGHVSPGIAEFQAGSLEVCDIVAQWIDGFGLTTQAMRAQLALWARQLWEDPPAGVADIWFSSDHDDSFGALNHSSFEKDRPNPSWLTGDLRGHVQRGMRASEWSAGYRAWPPVSALVALGGLK